MQRLKAAGMALGAIALMVTAVAVSSSPGASAATLDLTSPMTFNTSDTFNPSVGPSGLTLQDGELGQATSAFFSTGIGFPAGTAFTATFSFTLQQSDSFGIPHADGLAFVIQNEGTSYLGTGGGNIGLKPASSSVAVVFQSWDNNRAAIVTDGDPFSDPSKAGNFNLGDQDEVVDVSVIYDGTKLSFSAHNLTTDVTVADELTVSLSDLAGPGGELYFGFTSGTGAQTSLTRVNDFTLVATPIPAALPLFASGLAAFGVFARRRRRAKA